MAVYVCDPTVAERVKAEREISGADRFDEVWEGVYVMPPLANTEHQALATRLAIAIHSAMGAAMPGEIYVGVNVSDREEDWKYNYRIPDVAVVLVGGRARDCDTHLYGGPDFVVEIVSPQDLSREKFRFYAAIGVRELLLIDRDPWILELYQLQDDQLIEKGRSRIEQPAMLVSNVLPISLRLMPGEPRPVIELTHHDGMQRWLV